jgi:hypothetical protein
MSSRYAEVWKAIDPPADFADRVAALAKRADKRRFTRRAAFGLAAAACTALATWKADRVLGRRAGDFTAVVRSEVQIAPGAIAVLERGARLLWDRDGARQVQGDVSYRLLSGVALAVETALGILRAVGSCCRVKIADSAGPAGAMFVSVTGGDLDVVSTVRRVSLHTGQYARVTLQAVDTQAEDASGDIARALDLPFSASRPATPPAPTIQETSVVSAPKRPADRAARPAAPPQAPSVDAGARTVIVPSCFCDRGDSLCACFH